MFELLDGFTRNVGKKKGYPPINSMNLGEHSSYVSRHVIKHAKFSRAPDSALQIFGVAVCKIAY